MAMMITPRHPVGRADPTDLTVLQVADRLNVHRNTISRYLKDGRFPGAYRLPGDRGEWRIPESAVELFIRRGRP